MSTYDHMSLSLLEMASQSSNYAETYWSAYSAANSGRLDEWLRENIWHIKLKKMCHAHIIEPPQYGKILRMMLSSDSEMRRLAVEIIKQLWDSGKQ